jgi:UDP-N-acetyl-D-mannosaminuronic acid dehydrogenase
MPYFVVEQLKKIVPDNRSKVAVFGLPYKGNIDDIRESSAMDVLNILQQEGYRLGVYDPHVR